MAASHSSRLEKGRGERGGREKLGFAPFPSLFPLPPSVPISESHRCEKPSLPPFSATLLFFTILHPTKKKSADFSLVLLLPSFSFTPNTKCIHPYLHPTSHDSFLLLLLLRICAREDAKYPPKRKGGWRATRSHKILHGLVKAARDPLSSLLLRSYPGVAAFLPAKGTLGGSSLARRS